MGSDNLFHKRREENIQMQRSSKWLLVCEGKQTEPNYFKGAVDAINEEIDERLKELE